MRFSRANTREGYQIILTSQVVGGEGHDGAVQAEAIDNAPDFWDFDIPDGDQIQGDGQEAALNHEAEPVVNQEPGDFLAALELLDFDVNEMQVSFETVSLLTIFILTGYIWKISASYHLILQI